MTWMLSILGTNSDAITAGQVAVLVIEGLISVVLVAAVPWAVLVERRLSKIEAMLTSRHTVEEEHDEIFARIRAIELLMARCGQCAERTDQVKRS